MKTMDEAFETAADFTRKAFEAGVDNTLAAVNGAATAAANGGSRPNAAAKEQPASKGGKRK
jgi:hypothetical protein